MKRFDTPQNGMNGPQHTGQVGQAVYIHTQMGDVLYLHPGALPGLQLEVNALSREELFSPIFRGRWYYPSKEI